MKRHYKKVSSTYVHQIAHTKNLSLHYDITFDYISGTAMSDIPYLNHHVVMLYLSARLLFNFYFSNSFMPLSFSINWHIDSCRWVILLLIFISMFIHFQLLLSFWSWNINYPWYLHFSFLRVSLIVWIGNFSKPIDFDQTVLSWIIYERWFFNLIFSHSSSPLWCSIRFLFHVLQNVYFIAIQFASLDVIVARMVMLSLVIQI